MRALIDYIKEADIFKPASKKEVKRRQVGTDPKTPQFYKLRNMSYYSVKDDGAEQSGCDFCDNWTYMQTCEEGEHGECYYACPDCIKKYKLPYDAPLDGAAEPVSEAEIFKPASEDELDKRQKEYMKDIETIYAPYTKSGNYVDIKCPHCGNTEEWPKDEQRWHTQFFDFIEIQNPLGPDPNEYTLYNCHECNRVFRVKNMFQPTPYDGISGDSEIDESENIFKPASKEEMARRHARPASKDEVDQFIKDDSETTFEELQLTVGEVDALSRMRHKMFYSISGGSGSGDWSNLYITEYDPESRIIGIKYEYGNDLDRWKEYGDGEYERTTNKFVFNESVNEGEIFKPASSDDVVQRRLDYAKQMKKVGGATAYYVDFSGWRLQAKDLAHAEARAMELLAQGKRPYVSGVETADDEYHSGADDIEVDRIPTAFLDKKPEPVTDEMGDYYIDFSCWIIKANNESEATDKAEAIMQATMHDGTVPSISSMESAGTTDHVDQIPVMEAEGEIFKPASDAEVKKRREDYNKAQLAKAEVWVATAKQELETELEVETAITSEDIDSFTLEADSKGNNGESEWIVFKDSDAAEASAVEGVRNDLETSPENFSQDWLMGFITVSDTDRRIIAGEESDNYVDELSDEDILTEANVEDENDEIQDQIDELDSDAGDYDDQLAVLEAQQEKILDDAKETVREKKYDTIYDALEDPIEYFVHYQGIYSVEELLKANFIRIDVNSAAQDAVDTDGIAHFLDYYDGSEVELPSGAIAYGTN